MRSRTARSCTLALAALLAARCADEPPPPGHIVADTVWSGTVTLTGDVFVDPGVTLTVAPGTRVVVAADQDDLGLSQLGPADEITRLDPTGGPEAGGVQYQQTHVAINVAGTIRSVGTADAPIVFTSSKAAPFYTDWVGISARNGEFAYTVVEWSIFGVAGGTGPEGLRLDHCHVRHMWGACVAFNGPVEGPADRHLRDSTVEDCGHEAVDTHSPGALDIGWNVLRRTQVGVNLHDDIDARIHHNVIVDATFPLIAINTKQAFATQNTLLAASHDPARWTYRGYAMPRLGDGAAAAVFVTNAGTTRMIATNSIVFDSQTGLRNEGPAGALQSGYLNLDQVDEPYAGNASPGDGALSVDSRFVDRAARDLRLRADSPARGAGNPADGRPDLGAFGGAQAKDSLGWQGP